MIDIKNTLLATIKDRIEKQRFLGEYSPAIFKNIMYLIVLDDLYDWSSYLDDPQTIQKKLQELRAQFVLEHGEFIMKMNDPEYNYVNVNTPQTENTWKRIWDSTDLFNADWDEITSVSVVDKHAAPFDPDPTCPVSLTYFGGTEDVISADTNGKPDVDFATLTTCEKMNFYINRESGSMYFLDPKTCTWETLKGDLATGVRWDSVLGRPDIYAGVTHEFDTANKQLNVSLEQAQYNSSTNSWTYPDPQDTDIPVTDNSEQSTNTDLDDVLS